MNAAILDLIMILDVRIGNADSGAPTGELQDRIGAPGIVQAGCTSEMAGRAWAWPPELVLLDLRSYFATAHSFATTDDRPHDPLAPPIRRYLPKVKQGRRTVEFYVIAGEIASLGGGP